MDAREQALAGLVVERPVARVGVEQRDVFVGAVDHVPEVAPRLDVAEPAASGNFVAPVCDRIGMRRPTRAGSCLRVVWHNRLVVLLDFDEERVAVRQEHVVRGDDGELSAFAEKLGCLRVAHLGGDPVEGGEGDDGVELRALRLPALEVRVDHLDAREVRQLALGDGGEVLAQFDARDRVAALRERQRGLAGATADLDEPRLRRKLGERHKVVEELRRVVRPGAVVELRHLIERRPQNVVRCVWHAAVS